MLRKYFITFCIILSFLTGYSQLSLIGNWRRVTSSSKKTLLNNNEPQYGDMQIHSDSTFHIQGAMISTSVTQPGWHTGEDITGNWEQKDSTYIILWLDPKNERLFLTYKIIKLTETKLIIRSLLGKNNHKPNIVFLRL